MNKRIIFACASLALLLPALAAEAPVQAQVTGTSVPPAVMGLDGIATPPMRVLEQARRPGTQAQVRIRERVIIRISPSPADTRQQMMSSLPRRPARTAYEEVPHEDCVPVDAILGVQPTRDNRLLLFMDNRQVLAARLDRNCTAQAFYSGFYVERNQDGRLCISRDMLQSRAGVSCSVEGLTRLVAVAG